MNKIKILVLQTDTGGCSKYRTVDPHKKIMQLYPDEFDITIATDWKNIEDYDIFQFHGGLFKNQKEFSAVLEYCKDNNIITVMDVDDYWVPFKEHFLYDYMIKTQHPERIIYNLENSDYITTTTNALAEKVKQYNEQVVVFPNALDSSFNVKKSKSDKIRFGFVMGNSHTQDLKEFDGVTKLIPKDTLNKIEFVLCGYPKSKITGFDHFGNPIVTPIQYEFVWKNYEKIIKDGAPHYQRYYHKDISTYNQFYSNIDVLLAPLTANEFNTCKSELKLIEGGFTNTPVICSDFGPYTHGGNCCIRCKDKEQWAYAITRLAQDDELRQIYTNNITYYINKNYNLNIIAENRTKWYKQILNKY